MKILIKKFLLAIIQKSLWSQGKILAINNQNKITEKHFH